MRWYVAVRPKVALATCSPAAAATVTPLRLTSAPKPWPAAARRPKRKPTGRTFTLGGLDLLGMMATATPAKITLPQRICSVVSLVPSHSHSPSAAMGAARHWVMRTVSREPSSGKAL